MAQGKPDTPEKQLLRLIEDPKARDAAKSQAAKRQGMNLVSPGAWAGRTSFFKKLLGSWFKDRGLSVLNIKALNRTLALCDIMLVIYFSVNFSNSMAWLKEGPDAGSAVKTPEKAPGETEITSLLKAESYYLDKIGRRNIFEMGKIEAEDIMDAAKVQLAPSVSAAVEATQHLKLVGISWSNSPDAMIEDTRALRTFFVKKGQMVGEVKVKDILRDRVILTYEGDDVELR